MTNPISKNPTAREIVEFHRNDDFNSRAEAHHHGLGNGSNESSYGNHVHDGQRGLLLLDGTVFTGSRTTNAASIINQLCEAMVKIGATNSTTA